MNGTDAGIDRINGPSLKDFVARYGAIYEHSPWVAERAWDFRPFGTISELHEAMKRVVAQATDEEVLRLIRAHPDLATRLEVSPYSVQEQAGAGLNQLSEVEYTWFTQMNKRYTETFGFPFIIAVRDQTKESIMAAMRQRLANPAGDERREALSQIHRIAWLRLQDLLAPPAGRLTTHVLDVSAGQPASGMTVELRYQADERNCGPALLLLATATNADG